jgi:Asp-tRNA(Asn)/Glu-tRNA(Gln) amidotransferase B subunit
VSICSSTSRAYPTALLNDIASISTGNERRRHLKHYLAKPDVPLRQETRGFDETTGQTFTLRTKEEAEDYRYMPDGNLSPIVIKPVSTVLLPGNLNREKS